MYRFITSFVLVTVLLIPLSVTAAPDPHTNITPLDEYVVQEIESFNNYVDRAQERGVIVNLPEALDDLAGVLESYLRLTNLE